MPKIPAELLLAFGQERGRLTKVYLASSPSIQDAIYKLYVEGDTTISIKQLSAVKQFPVKTRTVGKRVTLSIQ